MFSAPTISTTCAIHGAATPNIRPTSITFRSITTGKAAIIRRKILFTSGARCRRRISPSITKQPHKQNHSLGHRVRRARTSHAARPAFMRQRDDQFGVEALLSESLLDLAIELALNHHVDEL